MLKLFPKFHCFLEIWVYLHRDKLILRKVLLLKNFQKETSNLLFNFGPWYILRNILQAYRVLCLINIIENLGWDICILLFYLRLIDLEKSLLLMLEVLLYLWDKITVRFEVVIVGVDEAQSQGYYGNHWIEKAKHHFPRGVGHVQYREGLQGGRFMIWVGPVVSRFRITCGKKNDKAKVEDGDWGKEDWALP